MISILTQPLETIRARYGDDVTAARVAIAAHEAAHAVVAAALGYRVDRLTITRTAGDAWEGRIEWDKLTADPSDAATVAVAGLIGTDALGPDLRSRVALPGLSEEDVDDLGDALPGVTADETLQALRNAKVLITQHRDAFDRLTRAAVDLQTVNASEIRACLGRELAGAWTAAGGDRHATRRALSYRVGTATIETRAAVPGMRYSDPAPMERRSA